jgi:hypothetical protein
MKDLETALQQLAERGSPAGSEGLRERVAMALAGAASPSRVAIIPKWAIAAVVAAATIVLVGGPIVLFGGSDGPVASQPLPPATTAPPPTTTIVEVTTTAAEILPPVGAWNPMLVTTAAGVPPPAATCPTGATPDLPGAPGQDRPGEGRWNNQAAVFDTHAGRIVFVDEVAVTWTFDVCTNRWERMDPEGTPYGRYGMVGELVYDIDSDRTIAFGSNDVSVYDATTNSWSTRPLPPEKVDTLLGVPGLGAIYDPSTGLVLAVTGDGLLTAYDVDTDEWTDIGTVIEERETTYEGQTKRVVAPFLIGHVAEIDRLAFLPFDAAPFQDRGRLVNPRTGEFTLLDPPDGGVWGGFGAFRYATGGATAHTFGGAGVCRLDPATLHWECSEAGRQVEGPSAMVYDSINDRIVVINDHCCNWPGRTVTDGVYAIDFETGERIELLAAADTRIETDGS